MPPPIVRPVEMTLVPDSVSTFEDVAETLTRTSEICTLLSNQRTVMKNTFFLRASLITHLVTRVRDTLRYYMMHADSGVSSKCCVE